MPWHLYIQKEFSSAAIGIEQSVQERKGERDVRPRDSERVPSMARPQPKQDCEQRRIFNFFLPALPYFRFCGPLCRCCGASEKLRNGAHNNRENGGVGKNWRVCVGVGESGSENVIAVVVVHNESRHKAFFSPSQGH